MRIGFFMDSFYPMVDGVTIVMDNYARRMCQKHDVTIFCPRVDVHYDYTQFPYRVVCCESAKVVGKDYRVPLPEFDVRFREELENSNLDIVHVHSPFMLGRCGVKYAKKHGIPVVATLHSQFRQDFERAVGKTKLADALLKYTMKTFNACDECWTVNGAIRDLYLNDYGLTTPCGIRPNATAHHPVPDRQAACAEINALHGISPDETVYLFVGRINYIKNIDFLVRSLAVLRDRGRKFRMLFVGCGEDEEKLIAEIAALGLNGCVTLCGKVADPHLLEKYYARAKLFLFPSLYDTNSLVQIEASAQGTPTLFLRGARTAATVTEDVNGFFADATPEAYAEKIMQIENDPAYYSRVADGAFRDLYRHWDGVVKESLDRYAELIALRGGKNE